MMLSSEKKYLMYCTDCFMEWMIEGEDITCFFIFLFLFKGGSALAIVLEQQMRIQLHCSEVPNLGGKLQENCSTLLRFVKAVLSEAKLS